LNLGSLGAIKIWLPADGPGPLNSGRAADTSPSVTDKKP
jgi:hypothetical protein